MKIGLITPGFSAHEHDWCIPALLNYVRVLASQAEVHVFTLRWPEQGQAYRVFGATVHALDGRKQMGVRALNLWVRALRAIAAEHRRAPFDVLHAFWADEPGWVAAWTGAQLGVPVIISLAGGELIGLRDIGYGLQLVRGRKPLIRWSLQQAARVTVGSDYLCKLARAHLPQAQWGKLVRAPLGVDTRYFAPLTPDLVSDRPVGREEKVTVLNVGSLYPVKDHALLLRAFRRVAAQLPAAHLQIVGDGPLERELKQRAEGLKVSFRGNVNHADLPVVYRTASVFVQTSRHEAQGMAVLEAAACGLPVVGTPVGALPEIGLIARDEVELSGQLVDLLRDKSRRRTVGESAREKVFAEYSLNVAVERFVRLYTSLRGA